jgi:hypothetical protein
VNQLPVITFGFSKTFWTVESLNTDLRRGLLSSIPNISSSPSSFFELFKQKVSHRFFLLVPLPFLCHQAAIQPQLRSCFQLLRVRWIHSSFENTAQQKKPEFNDYLRRNLWTLKTHLSQLLHSSRIRDKWASFF